MLSYNFEALSGESVGKEKLQYGIVVGGIWLTALSTDLVRLTDTEIETYLRVVYKAYPGCALTETELRQLKLNQEAVESLKNSGFLVQAPSKKLIEKEFPYVELKDNLIFAGVDTMIFSSGLVVPLYSIEALGWLTSNIRVIKKIRKRVNHIAFKILGFRGYYNQLKQVLTDIEAVRKSLEGKGELIPLPEYHKNYLKRFFAPFSTQKIFERTLTNEKPSKMH